MAKFIELNMFKEQNQGKGKNNYGTVPFPAPRVPFPQWKVGYIVKGSTEEWTIKKIDSIDGTMHYEDCTITIVNNDEIREVKANTLRKSYTFVSSGDQPSPLPTERDDTQIMLLNIEGIREVYPRQNGEGSRILMMDKTAYICADDIKEITAKIKSVGGFDAAGVVHDKKNEGARAA